MDIQLGKLSSSRETLTGVLDFLPYPFLLSEVNAGSRVNVFVNEKFREEIGYTVLEIQTMDTWFDTVYPNPGYRKEVREEWRRLTEVALQRGEDSICLQVAIQTKHRGTRWYEVKSSLGDVQFVAFIDIHNVKLKEEALLESNENRERILSILGHDLRGPISNLHSVTEFMLTSDIPEKEFKILLKEINEKAFQSLEFLNTTLIWTKSNFDRIIVRQEWVMLNDVLNNIMLLYQHNLETKSIKIDVQLEPQAAVFTDRELVIIILRNLISNSIKFTPEMGTIVVGTKAENGNHIIWVKDSGMGMDHETLKNIEGGRYFSRAGTNREKGMGLGLKMCKTLVTFLNGRLIIRSSVGKGTEIELTLPAVLP